MCDCGHYWIVHDEEGCGGWSRRRYWMLWFPFGFRGQLLRLCPCRMRRIDADD